MNSDDLDFESWLFDADRDLEESTAAEIDVEDMLALVKQRPSGGSTFQEIARRSTALQHLLPSAVAAFTSGTLTPFASAQAEAHIARCAHCAEDVRREQSTTSHRPPELPVVQENPGHDPHPLTDDAPTERTPIYEAVLSAWFEGPTSTAPRPPTLDRSTPRSADTGGNQPSPSEGWFPTQVPLDGDGATADGAFGLPRRVPKANLVPGRTTPAPKHAAETPPPSPTPRSAYTVRGRMSSYQEGVRRGQPAYLEEYANSPFGLVDASSDDERE
jgi:hypothetical protein